MSEPIPGVAVVLRRRFFNADRAMVDRFGDPFRPLELDCKVIQFRQPLSPAQLRKAGDLLVNRPDVELYVYGRASMDLNFLSYFRTVRRLHVARYDLDDITGFSYLDGGLDELIFGQTRKKFPLRFIETLPHLKKLFLVGHQKGLHWICTLNELTSLGLSRITLPDLSALLSLTRLRQLSVLLGGTTNLSLLPQFPELADLFLMRITK